MSEANRGSAAAGRRALGAYGLERAGLLPIVGGLINRTYLVDAGGDRFVLQWVNPIFDPRIHEDIEAATAHLAQKGLVTPRLLRTLAGALWVAEAEGGVWRLMTFVGGRTLHRVTSPAIARSAGELVGRFHRAVDDLRCDFHHARLGVHDTQKHLALLRETLETHGEHARHAVVEPMAREILAMAAALPPLPMEPRRVVHGDLKISNLLFEDGRDEARALLDLDTLARMPIAVELGDALRSWCNPLGEEASDAAVRAELFEAAVEGYAAGAAGLLDAREWGALADGATTIALELSARFCADALRETYFGWDPSRFPSRGEHNEIRAASQLALARSFAKARPELQAVLRRAFG